MSAESGRGEDEEHSCPSDAQSCHGRACRSADDGGAAEQQCDDGHDDWICQCRFDEPASGDFDYFGCKYRYNDDRTDYSI